MYQKCIKCESDEDYEEGEMQAPPNGRRTARGDCLVYLINRTLP